MPSVIRNFYGNGPKCSKSKIDGMGPAQRVVIPKGLIDPKNTTVIEIPTQFTGEAVVFAKPKDEISHSLQNSYTPESNQTYSVPSVSREKAQRKNVSYGKKINDSISLTKQKLSPKVDLEWNEFSQYGKNALLDQLKEVEKIEENELTRTLEAQLERLHACRREKISQIVVNCFDELAIKA